jgi:hypothetical protein
MRIILTYKNDGVIETTELDMDELGPGYEEVIVVDGRRIEITVED